MDLPQTCPFISVVGKLRQESITGCLEKGNTGLIRDRAPLETCASSRHRPLCSFSPETQRRLRSPRSLAKFSAHSGQPVPGVVAHAFNPAGASDLCDFQVSLICTSKTVFKKKKNQPATQALPGSPCVHGREEGSYFLLYLPTPSPDPFSPSHGLFGE